ncbi:MAG TPA: AtpZ/AtpI family protein [Syntrophales bacterium]|nr:AtpZ/AtpI family protein [Syntrophales bacterium]
MDKETRKAAIQLAYASSIGIAFVLFIIISLWLGVQLDRNFGTGYKLTILLLIIGIGAGFWNIYGLVKKFSWDEKPIIKYLKSEPHRKRPPPKKA